ncbi:MAG: hypothetical protein LBQ15_06045 [Clostridium sp.]|jgi:hypothetical protein|nr:hypothetical protein [Clostridium sp.]
MPLWSYNIVPNLVHRLAEAVEAEDKEAALENFSLQGVTLDKNSNLWFTVDLVADLLASHRPRL